MRSIRLILLYLLIALSSSILGNAMTNIGENGEIYWDKVYEWEDSIVSESDWFMKFEETPMFYKLNCNFRQEIPSFYGTISAIRPFRVNIPKSGFELYYYTDDVVCIKYVDEQYVFF